MKTSFEGIISAGVLHLSEPVPLPDESRVNVTVVPVEMDQPKWAESLANLEALRSAEPIRSGGERFSREQLNERG